MRTMLVVLVVAHSLAACGADAPGPEQPATPTGSTATSEERWIAVIEVAPRPDDLDALTQRLLDPLGVALMVSPVECFQGLPPDVRDGYLIGAVGDSRNEVERLVTDAGEEVVFSANVTILCVD